MAKQGCGLRMKEQKMEAEDERKPRVAIERKAIMSVRGLKEKCE
jgi:hypothetical protein